LKSLPRAGSTGAYLLAARPKTLPAAAAPVIVGSACAFEVGGFALLPGLLALTCALLIQIGTNFANDLFDYEKGHDTGARIGPVRAVQSGLLSSSQMRVGTGAVFLLAVLFGVLLVARGGLPVAVIGVASIVAGVAYTAGPYPLGHNGLGDLFVMLFFGFVAVCGTAFVQAGFVPLSAWVLSIGVGALSTAILVVNNVRDYDTDKATSKRTLAVILGRSAGQAEYVGLVFIAYVAPVALHFLLDSNPWILLPWMSIPVAVSTIRRFLRADTGAMFNRALAATGRLLLLYAVLGSAGLVMKTLG
jgi:1,4-dihydroxy-2-naphthoate octaprenyltransferase